jgi:hypothetical protein
MQTALLKEAYRTHTEYENSLNIARSNLKLVIANNDMLEDALKRDSLGKSKDIGWQRRNPKDDEGSSEGATHAPDGAAAVHDSATASPVEPPQDTSQDSHFFGIRFSTGSFSTSSFPYRKGFATFSTRSSTPNGQLHPSHLSSASMPSLVPVVNPKEVEDLRAELEVERKARKVAWDQKLAIEAEIETLSQALFEEVRLNPHHLFLIIPNVSPHHIQANKMVASERIRRAEIEEELRQTLLEKEALRSALQILEGENGRLRTLSDAGHLTSGAPSSSGAPEACLPPSPSPTLTRSFETGREDTEGETKAATTTVPVPHSQTTHAQVDPAEEEPQAPSHPDDDRPSSNPSNLPEAA